MLDEHKLLLDEAKALTAKLHASTNPREIHELTIRFDEILKQLERGDDNAN